MPRYASRSSMRRHHRVVNGSNGYGRRPRPAPPSGSDVRRPATCTDAIVGRYRVTRRGRRRKEPVESSGARVGSSHPERDARAEVEVHRHAVNEHAPVGHLGVVARTLTLMIVRRVLDVLGCGPTPDADVVEFVVLRHADQSELW